MICGRAQSYSTRGPLRVSANLQSRWCATTEPKVDKRALDAGGSVTRLDLDENDRFIRLDLRDSRQRSAVGVVGIVIHCPAGDVRGRGADIRDLEPVILNRTVAARP